MSENKRQRRNLKTTRETWFITYRGIPIQTPVKFTTVKFSSETSGARRKLQHFLSAGNKGLQTVTFISHETITQE